MLYRVFDLGYSKLKSGIDDEPLQRLLHGHEVVSRQERFYVHDGLPHLVVSVLYRLGSLAPPALLPVRHPTRRRQQRRGYGPGTALPVWGSPSSSVCKTNKSVYLLCS